ncbi:MAG: DUF222 domain-containing protein [Pseudolysinimonas sp.]
MAPLDLANRFADPTHADVRIEFALARAEYAHRAASRATAQQWAAIAEVLDEARRSPDVYVDPALPMRHKERREFAERAAAADIAVRLGLSESAVRTQAHEAETLRTRLPRVWSEFCEGELAPPQARVAAELVLSLPDDRELDAQFDGALAGIVSLPAGRFRVRARVLRERIHSVAMTERVRAAKESRGVWIDNDIDGMALLSMKLPAETAHLAFARVDAAARAAALDPTETRTLAQLRADIAADLLISGELGDGRVPIARVDVGVLIPMLTLLGLSDEPGHLDGYGPIDAETARRLAAHAPSFRRLLTHPVSGTLLGVDRTSYRPPADLKRWLAVTDQTCRFVGCGRLARNSDIDHTIDRQYGGATRADNLAHLCRHHHRLKHMTKWTVEQEKSPDRRISWTSPTGHQATADPPPF